MYKIIEKCRFCGTCITVCPVEAVEKSHPIYSIDPDKCLECGECEKWCRFGAIINLNDHQN